MSIELELPGAIVCFSERGDGDLGRTAGEPSEAVLAARAGMLARLPAGGVLVGHQVHGSAVAQALDPRGCYVIAADDADGRLTSAGGIAVGVHTADCLPIALAGDGGVAVLHAGWRGLLAGVIAAGVAAMRAHGVVGALSAAIGPGAGPCCYEVSGELRERFASYGAAPLGRLDLPAIATRQLRENAVRDVIACGLCTICAPERFFSHRREGDGAGRQGAFAWLS